MTEAPAADAATPEALRQLARTRTTINLPAAGRFFGLGANTSYDLAGRGEFPCRVLRIGKQYRVPTTAVAEVLGIDLDHDDDPQSESPERDQRFREDQAGWRRRIDAARRSDHRGADAVAPRGEWSPQ